MTPADLFNVAGAVTGLAGTAYNLYANKRDYDYQKSLQQQIFQREDTAVQRRMEDLKKAGLNPNLATGSAAQAGAVVSRSNTNDVNFGAAIDSIAAVQQIRNSRVQSDVMKADAKLKDAEAADKVYDTMLHMGIDATPYYDKGKFNFNVHNDGVPTDAYFKDFYHGRMEEQKRSWERNEETFQSNMNVALSKINLNTSQINQVTNSIDMSRLEFQQRLNEFGLKITEANYSMALNTYQELRQQLATKTSNEEKMAAIKHMIKQDKHLDVQEQQAWTKLLLDLFDNDNGQGFTNALSLLYALY